MKKLTRSLLIIMIVLSLMLTGCGRHSTFTNGSNEGGYDSGYYFADFAYEADVNEEIAFVEDGYALSNSKAIPSAASADDVSDAQQRMIRKTASINIQVMDPVAVAETISDLTEKMGGFVVSSASSQEYYSSEINLPRVNLSIRVPSERLNEMLDFIEGQTSDTSKYVSNKNIRGYDITSEYVDTNSRLTSLEKTREKLYEILETAENASEALEVYSSISDVESEIEVYKGQIKYMEESVALSSIDIVITSIRPAPVQSHSRWNLGDVFSDAFDDLLGAIENVIEFLVYAVVVGLPVIILLAIPVVIVILVIRKIRKSKKTSPSPEKTVDTVEKIEKH